MTVQRGSFEGARAPLAIGCVGLVLSAAAGLFTAADIRERERRDLDLLARDARTAIERRVAQYAETLYGLRTLYAEGAAVTRAEFRRSVTLADIGGRLPGIQALSFARAVPSQRKDAYEAGFASDLSVDEPAYKEARIHPDSPSAVLYVVETIEPVDGNEQAIGLDHSADPVRRRAIEEARDTGDLVATQPITLVQETGGQRGFLMHLPVYDTPELPVTPPARRRHLVGVATAVFRTADMLSGALGIKPRVRIAAIYDVGPTVEPPGELDDGGLLMSDPRGRGDGSIDLNIGNRRWRMLVALPSGDAGLVRDPRPWGAAAITTLVSALVAGIVWSFSRSRARAVNLASTMTLDLRERERELQEANAELQAVNASLRDFVAVAAHDIRTPVAALLGYGEIMDARWDAMTDEQRRSSVEAINRQAGRLNELLRDLLLTSEIDSRDIRVRPADLSVRGVLASVVEGFPDATLDCDASLSVHADEGHLRRMAVNLLTNARKYAAGPVRVVARPSDGSVEIRFEDAGPGVPEEFVPRLFHRFSRAEVHRATDSPKGTGLGLSIVRGLATANGGQVWYEPGDPAGARFVIRLPARASGAEGSGSELDGSSAATEQI